MKQIDRYLRAIKFFLPKPQQNDILAEISEDIHSQIDDLEAERGRKLNDAEIAAVLKKRGSPNLVAGAYLPQKYLIGPAWYPLYRWILTLVILLVQVPLFVTVIGPMNVLNSTAILPALFQTLGEFLQAALVAFAWITGIFALMERPDLFTFRRGKRDEPRTSITDLVNALSWIPLWIYLVRWIPRFNFGGVHLVLAPIWQTLFWPVLALAIAAAALRVFSFVSTTHAKFHRLARLAVDGFALLAIGLLFTTSNWVHVAAPNLTAATEQAASRWGNLTAAVFLMTVVVMIALATIRDWRGLPKNIQNRGKLPPDLRQGTIVE